MPRTLAAAAALTLSTASALGTWSMILVDTHTGEVAVGSCTCLTNLDLQALTPVLITGVGAAAAQSFGDTSGRNRTFIRDRMGSGLAPADILAGLAVFDPGHETRQYGFVDIQGRAATFTGTDAGGWAGGQTGEFLYTYAGKSGRIVYAVQGNVLTGAAVVQASVDAIRGTEGDLAARFMAGMEAARAMGGDGRCSCPGGVTTCGAPPAAFTKSAHIGYMLIARAGDRDGSTGVYQAGQNPSEFGIGDLTGDGRPEIIGVTPGTPAPAGVLVNLTAPGSPFPAFSAPTLVGVPNSTRLAGVADFTGEGTPDLLAVSSTLASVIPGLGNLTFGTRRDTPVPLLPLLARGGDLDGVDGPDVVIFSATNSTLMTLLNDGAGTLEAPLTRTAGSGSNAVVLTDADGNGSTDALVVSRTTARLLLLRGNNDGTFTDGDQTVIPANSVGVAAADFDGDGDQDAATVSQNVGRALTVYTNNGLGQFTQVQSVPLALNPLDVVAGDFNADGRADLAVSTASSRVLVFLNSGTGTFALTSNYSTGFALTRLSAADLNADGRSDLVFNAPSGGVGVCAARPDGTFPALGGTAGGEYFLTLNVPNTTASDPDPVLTLRTQFDAWRAGLTGRVDAVQSLVDVPVLRTYGPGARSGVMRITLRDWRGALVTGGVASVTVSRRAGGPGTVSAGPVVQAGPGVYDVPLSSAGDGLAPDQFEVVVDEPPRRVVLMPRTSVRQWQCPSDYDGDGDHGTAQDIEAFFACLAGTCCGACLTQDVNADGDHGTDQDVEAFFAAIAAGCG